MTIKAKLARLIDIYIDNEETTELIVHDVLHFIRSKDINELHELDLARSAPETTASPSETAADKGILTEEELNRHEDTLPQLVQSVSIAGCILEIIESHRNLLSANAELSFYKNKYHEALNSMVDGNWSCAYPNGLEVWSTDRINPKKIALEALEETK